MDFALRQPARGTWGGVGSAESVGSWHTTVAPYVPYQQWVMGPLSTGPPHTQRPAGVGPLPVQFHLPGSPPHPHRLSAFLAGPSRWRAPHAGLHPGPPGPEVGGAGGDQRRAPV